MTSFAAAADALTNYLSLESPPVALALTNLAPELIAPTQATVPSACSFWRRAETETFYAPQAAHLNCPVGAMVMGFELSEESMQQLMQAAELMIGCGYLAADEVPNIPAMKGSPRGIVYGPLREFEQVPDTVLVWLSPREAMRFSEAAGSCAWTGAQPVGVLGRPACAALPTAQRTNAATLSLGCAGMRTFTEISNDRLLGAIPGDILDAFVDALGRTVDANAAMQRYYDGRKTEVAASGQSGSVGS